MTTYDDPTNYSVSVLWRTGQRVAAVSALREAGINHGISLLAAKRALDERLGTDKTNLVRNTSLILAAAKAQTALDAEKEQERKDTELLAALKHAIGNVPANGHGYDAEGNYVGKTCTDEDYTMLGRVVTTLYSHYMNN